MVQVLFEILLRLHDFMTSSLHFVVRPMVRDRLSKLQRRQQNEIHCKGGPGEGWSKGSFILFEVTPEIELFPYFVQK